MSMPFNINRSDGIQFQSDGPAWVLKNSKPVMYLLAVLIIAFIIIIYLYNKGYIVYGKCEPDRKEKKVRFDDQSKPDKPAAKAEPKPSVSRNSAKSPDDALSAEIDEINSSQQ